MAQEALATRSTAEIMKAPTRRLQGGPSPSVKRLVKWMRSQALPFWSTKGWDQRRGGFHERFFFDGMADDLVERRTRVQWRQIYTLAHASELGWCEGLRIAFKGLEHLLEKSWAPDGKPGFVHALTPDGRIADARRDAYDHAAAILALAWLARTTGDAQVNALLNLVLDFCENQLTDAKSFLREAIPEQLPRRQVPHMHMLEAMMAAVETVSHPEAALRATRYRRMLEQAFLHRTTGMLIENFDNNWRPVMEDEAFAVVPGHMANWVWLIRRYERLFGQKTSPLGTHLLGAALRAAEPLNGFLIDEIDSAQRVRQASRRLWPQTELVKAWLAQFEIGVDRADEPVDMLIDRLLESYLSGPFAGGWYDSYTDEGAIGTDTVPAATLYHVFLMTAEAHRLMGQ